MSMRLSFCVKAATSLDADDLDTLTEGIEGYVQAGVGERQAEGAALADLRAAVNKDRAAVMALVREQHPDLFLARESAPELPAVTVAPGPKPKVYKTRADATVGDFELGQDADRQMSGMGDMFQNISRAPQTDSKAFRDWFGSSVVTESGKAGGKPLVVYHGSPHDIQEYKPNQGVIWFTNRKGLFKDGRNTFENATYLAIENPLDLYEARGAYDVATWREIFREQGLGDAADSLKFDSAIDADAEVRFGYLFANVDAELNGDTNIAKVLQDAGYDGILAPSEISETGTDKTFVVFRPDQIKSAIGNRGTFDPADPNIAREREAAYTSANGQQDGVSEPGATAGTEPATADAVRRAGGAVPSRFKALGIAADIQSAGSTALVGRTVRSADDLAELAQVYRDPRYETFRLFFTKGNEIVHATGVSARLPSMAPMIPKGVTQSQYVEMVQGDMARTGADGYYILHNHPSGDPTPSSADMQVTAWLGASVPGLRAHVVVNSGKYAVIDPGKGARVETKDFGPDLLLKASKPSPLLGAIIADPAGLAVIGKSVQRQGWVTLIGTSNNNKVRVVADAPSSILSGPSLVLAATLRRTMRMSGATNLSLVGSDADIASAPVRAALERGLLRDAVGENGRTMTERGIGGENNKAFVQTRGRFVREAGVATGTTAKGYPEFASGAVTIAFPQPTERFEVMPGPGQEVLSYAIMPGSGFDVLGHVELLVENGRPVALLDIEVYADKGRGQGVGRAVIETLLAANPDADLNISNIVDDARGFWERMGVPQQNLEQGAAYEGTLNWQTYTANIRQASSDTQGRGRGREQSAAGGPGARQGAARQGGEAGRVVPLFVSEREGAAYGAGAAPGRAAAGKVPADSAASSRSDSTARDVWDLVKSAKTPAQGRAAFLGMTESINRFNLWDKTIGTQLNMARKNKFFARVFEGFQQQQDDTAAFAIEAEAEAVDVLARMSGAKETFGSLKAAFSGERSKDLSAVSKAVFANIEGKTGVKQKVFTDTELARDYGLNERQIGQYRQARAAIDRSLDRYAQSLAVRIAQKFVGTEDITRAGLDETAEAVLGRIQAQRDELGAGEQDPEQDKQIEALDAAIEKIAEIQKTANDLKDAGYAPAMRFGDYAVTATRADGTVEFFKMVDSKLQANILRMRLRDEFPGAEITANAVDKESFKIFGGMSPDTVELFAKFMEVDKTDAFKEYIALATSSRSALKHMLERKGIAGFSENLPQVLAAFITSNSRAAARNINGAELADAMESVQKNARGDVSEQAAKLYQYMQNPTDDGAKIRGFMFAYFMGGSVASALVNITQPVMMTAPYLHQFAGNKIAGIMVRAGKTAATGETTNGALKAAMARAATEGVTDTHEYYQMMQEAEGASSVPGRAAMKAWGAMFGAAEKFNRAITFAAAYEVAQGMTPAQIKAAGASDAYSFAKRAVEETQGVYARHNRPTWARGTAGALLMTFKQFSIAYIEFFMRLPTKQKAIALALLVLMAGIEGLPFAEDLEDLIDTLGQKMGYATNSKKALRTAATAAIGEAGAQFALHGISGLSGVPMDVAGRLGMGSLIPGTKLFNPSVKDKGREVLDIAGAAGGLAKKALDAVDQADPSRAFPSAMANAAKAIEMFNTGQYRDTKGYRVKDTDTMDATMKLIGFQPQSVAAASRNITENMRDVDIVRRVESEIVGQWAEGIRSKDMEQVAAARQRLKDWNEDNPSLPIRVKMSQIVARVKASNLTRDERFMKTVPPEVRRKMLAEAAL